MANRLRSTVALSDRFEANGEPGRQDFAAT
jgi:hypothetical protein